jgi:hypothetical protein
MNIRMWGTPNFLGIFAIRQIKECNFGSKHTCKVVFLILQLPTCEIILKMTFKMISDKSLLYHV